jgi:NAD(P)-dependent dehydrogenase (short-subunit alcohol dehydrogenase family)
MDAPRSPRSPRSVALHVEAGPAPGARPSEAGGAMSPRAGATSPRAGAAQAALPDLGFGFRGSTVMVTGAGGQFGRAGCVYFARCGANVVLLDLAPAALAEAQAEVQAAHRAAGLGSASCLALQCDITDAAAVHRAVTEACRAFPAGIDCLWNNAGYQGEMRPIQEYQARDFEKVMSVNVVGAFNVLQAVAQAMIARGRGGSVVNTASVAALRGTPTMCAYVASKAALIGLTTCAAKDLAPYKIRVNAISPAYVVRACGS